MNDKQFNKWKRNGNFKLSHKRILEVSNHISEGYHECYTKKEAAEVATYHCLDASRIAADLQAIKTEGLIKYSQRLIKEMEKHQKDHPSVNHTTT